MPRDLTLKPVALATIACSQLILVPSAKLVTMAGFCPHRSAKFLLSRWISIGILQAFDVADDARDQTEPLDPTIKIHLDARLVAVACRKDDAVLLCVDLQNWTDRCIDFGVHQDDVFAVLERLQNDVGAKLDRAGRIHQHVDEFGARHQERIFGGHRFVRANCVVEPLLRFGDDDILVAAVMKDVDRSLDVAVGDRDDPHSGNAVRNLVG